MCMLADIQTKFVVVVNHLQIIELSASCYKCIEWQYWEVHSQKYMYSVQIHLQFLSNAYMADHLIEFTLYIRYSTVAGEVFEETQHDTKLMVRS